MAVAVTPIANESNGRRLHHNYGVFTAVQMTATRYGAANEKGNHNVHV